MRGVARNAPLQHRDHLLGEIVQRAFAVDDGGRLKSVKFVEPVVDRSVCDEMVYIVLFGGEALCVVDERGGAGKGIVNISDQLGVRESLSSQLWSPPSVLAFRLVAWLLLTSAGNASVKSLNSRSRGPRST